MGILATEQLKWRAKIHILGVIDPGIPLLQWPPWTPSTDGVGVGLCYHKDRRPLLQATAEDALTLLALCHPATKQASFGVCAGLFAICAHQRCQQDTECYLMLLFD